MYYYMIVLNNNLKYFLTPNIFFFLIFYSFKNYFIVVQAQLCPFSTHHFPQPCPSSPPTLNPIPLWLCPWVLYTCSFTALTLLSHIIYLMKLFLNGAP